MNNLKNLFAVCGVSAVVFMTIVLCIPSNSKYYDWAKNPSKLDNFLNVDLPEYQSVDTLWFAADSEVLDCMYRITFRDTIPQNIITDSYGARRWQKIAGNDNAYTYEYKYMSETCPPYAIDVMLDLEEQKATIWIMVDETDYDGPPIFRWSLIFFALIWIPFMLLWFGFIIISKIRDKIKAR